MAFWIGHEKSLWCLSMKISSRNTQLDVPQNTWCILTLENEKLQLSVLNMSPSLLSNLMIFCHHLVTVIQESSKIKEKLHEQFTPMIAIKSIKMTLTWKFLRCEIFVPLLKKKGRKCLKDIFLKYYLEKRDSKFCCCFKKYVWRSF